MCKALSHLQRQGRMKVTGLHQIGPKSNGKRPPLASQRTNLATIHDQQAMWRTLCDLSSNAKARFRCMCHLMKHDNPDSLLYALYRGCSHFTGASKACSKSLQDHHARAQAHHAQQSPTTHGHTNAASAARSAGQTSMSANAFGSPWTPSVTRPWTTTHREPIINNGHYTNGRSITAGMDKNRAISFPTPPAPKTGSKHLPKCVGTNLPTPPRIYLLIRRASPVLTAYYKHLLGGGPAPCLQKFPLASCPHRLFRPAALEQVAPHSMPKDVGEAA